MDVVGEKYEKKEMFLPQVLAAAQCMYAAIDILKPLLEKSAETAEVPGTVVIGVVEGDMHDIGKNIVRILLDGANYDVNDLGRDVPVDDFVNAVKENKADVAAMSTLMTTTLISMEDITKKLKEDEYGKTVKTIIGGAATNQAFADEIGADAWGADASSGLEKITKLIKERRG